MIPQVPLARLHASQPDIPPSPQRHVITLKYATNEVPVLTPTAAKTLELKFQPLSNLLQVFGPRPSNGKRFGNRRAVTQIAALKSDLCPNAEALLSPT